MDKTKLNLERMRAYDAEWDENKHPRADNGQFTSGGGSAGGSSSGSSTGGSSSASSTKKYNQKDLQELASNYLRYHLGSNETYATADKVEIVSEPDEHGNVDAKVSYDVTVRIPYEETDWDGYTRTTYEEEEEYRTDIIPLNISELKPEEPEARKSPLRKAAEAIKGGSGKSEGFNYSPEKKKNVLEILQRDINSFGPQSPVGEINSSLMNDLQKGKSFTVAVNNAKEKFKGKSDEHDAQLYNFYVMSKGPQGNENFSKEYKGNDFRSRKKVLEAEADSWLES